MKTSFLRSLQDQIRALTSGRSAQRRRRLENVSTEQLETRHMLAAVVELVGDSNTAPAGLPPNTEFVDVNGTLFFTASTVANGLELWKSDGTTEGTVRVSDIQAGPASSDIKYLTNVNGALFFSADDGVHGPELWKSDGTISGTSLVADFAPGPVGTHPRELVNSNGTLFFLGGYRFQGESVFKSDGTAAGTTAIGILPGPQPFLSNLTSIAGVPHFVKSTFGRSMSDQIWRTDGTFEGTVPVTAFPESNRTQIGRLNAADDHIYFEANDGELEWEIWTVDDSVVGAHSVSDIEPQPLDSRVRIELTIGSNVFFTYENGPQIELWRTDGTTDGIQFLSPSNGVPLTEFNGKAYFFQSGQLWKTDGTSAGTGQVTSGTSIFNGRMVRAGGNLYFVGIEAGRLEIWVLDGTTEKLRGLTHVDPSGHGFRLSTLVGVGSTLFMAADDGIHGTALWASDDTTDGTRMLKEIQTGNSDSSPSELTNVNGDLYFTADSSDPPTFRGIWKGPSGAHGTSQPLSGSPTAQSLVNANGSLFFVGSYFNGTNVWTANSSGVHEVRGDAFVPYYLGATLAVAGDTVYSMFQGAASTNSLGLWKTKGTAAETVLVHKFDSTSTIFESVSIGNSIYFVADDSLHGYELWKSDGTEAGTFMLGDLSQNWYTIPRQLTVAGDKVYFQMGSETAVTDGTIEGTKILGALSTQLSLHSPQEFASIDDTLFMSIFSPATGFELFKTKGSVETTSLVKDILPGDVGSRPRNLTNLNGKLVFVADEPAGRSLWASDGTSEGTRRLHQFGPVTDPSAGQNWSVVDGKVMFTVLDPAAGLRTIWISDGTIDGTLKITANLDETLVIDPATTFTKYGGGIAFAAATEAVGTELFRIDTIIAVTSPSEITLVDRLATETAVSGTDLAWADVAGAIQYDVWIQNLSNPSLPVVRKRVNEPRFSVFGNSVIEDNLNPGDAYRVWVRSLPVLGSPSAWSAAKDFVLGPDPVMHSVMPFSVSTKPTLSWVGPADVISYEIWLSNRDTKTRTLYETNLTTTTFAVTASLAPAKYEVWVRGTRADGTKTAWSTVNQFVVLAPPVTLTAGAGDQKSPRPTFTWSGVNGATGYDVSVYLPDGKKLVYSAKNITGLSHIPTQDLPAGKFVVYVRAMKNSQPFSAWGAGNALWMKLPPTNLRSTATGFAWDAVPFAGSYTFELRGTSGALYVPRTTQTGTTIELTAPLPPGKYTLRIIANYATSSSNWSETFSTELFHPPVSLTSSAAATVDATPTISWTATTGASSYELLVTKSGSVVPIYTRTGITGSSHRIDVPLARGINQIQVRAIFPDGSRSSLSAVQSLQIGIGTAVKFADKTLSWNAANGATNYELWIDYLGTPKQQKIVYQPLYLTTSYKLPSTLPKGRYQTWLRPVRAESGQLYYGTWTYVVFDVV